MSFINLYYYLIPNIYSNKCFLFHFNGSSCNHDDKTQCESQDQHRFCIWIRFAFFIPTFPLCQLPENVFFLLPVKKQTNQYIYFFFFCRVDSVAIWMDYIRCQKSQFHFFSPRTHFLFALYCRLSPTCFFLNFFFAQKCGHCTMKSICDKRKKGPSHKKNWIEMVERMATELN